ncbi:hypothetical protein K501DRAFT_277682 [Backusella circina FSU 941]|nr:hypothetical protein K501DRAFT_277682 [Backusella circina FSU 941]
MEGPPDNKMARLQKNEVTYEEKPNKNNKRPIKRQLDTYEIENMNGQYNEDLEIEEELEEPDIFSDNKTTESTIKKNIVNRIFDADIFSEDITINEDKPKAKPNKKYGAYSRLFISTFQAQSSTISLTFTNIDLYAVNGVLYGHGAPETFFTLKQYIEPQKFPTV